MKIHKLPKSVITKVAAGEVIESVSSVVKELIENSIDANSTKINIDLKEGGLTKIKVKDNGNGMSKKDLNICYKRYTTSKINKEEDLLKLTSLGFRGEALFSICNVSNLIIKSKLEENIEGYKLEINYGKKDTNIEPIGTPKGTVVEVNGLFNNLPPRKKHVKKNNEVKNLTQVITQQALANPNISFKLTNNNKVLLSINKANTLKSRIEQLYDYSDLMYFNNSKNGISIRGYGSKPKYVSKSKKNFNVFINYRSIQDAEIIQTVKECYGSLLDTGFYPYFIIFIKIPSEWVDSTIHPRKEQVNILNKKEILKQIKEEVKSLLNKNKSKSNLYTFTNEEYKDFAGFIKENIVPWSVQNESNEVLQVGKLYLITQIKDKLLIIDQHAAHEKILFNQFLNTYQNEGQKSKRLKKPISIKIKEKTKIDTKIINRLGIKIKKLKKGHYKLLSAPKVLHSLEIDKILIYTIDSYEREEILNNKVYKLLSHLACRTAVKANEILTQDQRKNLVNKVIETKDQVYTCPHGRPVFKEIELREIDKMFRRT